MILPHPQGLHLVKDPQIDYLLHFDAYMKNTLLNLKNCCDSDLWRIGPLILNPIAIY